MKRSALLVVFAAVAACTKPTTTLSHPLFWSVEKDGKITYLLGTMHVGVDARTKLPPRVWHQLDAAPVFAMETDLSDPVLATAGTRPDGGTLHADLGDTYWQKLQVAMTPANAAQIDHARPWIAAVTLAEKALPRTEPMDGALEAVAQHQKKDIVFLEPAKKQLDLLDKWMDVRAVKALLDHPEEASDHDKQMAAAYLDGDAEKMLALAADERTTAKEAGYTDAEYDQEMADFVYERNASWIDEIERLHARGNGFIAVGALHLIGERSVLDILAHRGYVVTRIDP